MEQSPRKTKYSAYQLSEICNRFHQVWSCYEKQKNDYGTGELYTSVEAHTVTHIEDHPGITVTQIAKDTFRTKSAVSQIVSKLEAKGLLRRERDPKNARQQLLYVTEKGLKLSRCHKIYDEKHVPQEDFISLFGPGGSDTFAEILMYFTVHMAKGIRDTELSD